LSGGSDSYDNPPLRGRELFKAVWRDRKTLPLSLAVAIVCLLSRAASLLTFVSWVKETAFKAPSDDEDPVIEVYVVAWLAVLIVLLFVFPKGGDPGLALVAVAMYRLQDLVLSTFDDALQLTKRFSNIDGASKVIFALVNLLQIVFIFAITFSVLTTSADWVSAPQPFGTFGCIVLSWTGLIPFGVSASAQGMRAQVLTMVESSVAVVILLIALSRFLSFAPPGSGAIKAEARRARRAETAPREVRG